MKPNLFTRFAIIIAVLLLAGLALRFKPLRGGIDLVGGTDLLYELDLTQNPKADPTDLANQVVDTLKKRIDPQGVKNLIWRVVEAGKRIEIQMPLPPKATRDARTAYDAADKALRDSNLDDAAIGDLLRLEPKAQTARLDSIAPGTSDRRTALEELIEAYNAKTLIDQKIAPYHDATLIPTDLIAALSSTQQAYEDALAKAKGTSLDLSKINDLLAAVQGGTNADAQKQLDDLLAKYPAQKPQLDNLISAYKQLAATGGLDLNSPEELQRRLRGSGVLEFRIAPRMAADADMMAIAPQAAEQLKSQGPRKPIETGSARYRWFQIDPKNGDGLLGSGFLTARYAGQDYILLYDDADHALHHNAPYQDWKVFNPSTGFDPESGGIDVNFSLDGNGTLYFGNLTRNNINRSMAIMLDGRALQAPNISTAITTGGCRITFGTPSSTRSADSIKSEALALVDMLKAGSLPATLQPDPISVRTISSSLGQDNINAGLRSGYYAVIAVMAFMVVYYTITGFFADLALAVNLTLLLACMAAFDATFTLPGIAGVVLTLGMAVDANVLINERIREELHKGASLWNAVKQGYDKVFWTIFDANLTTSLTSIVLIAVASEEVKGFGVTLLIGLLIHMFTALFVTRTLMVAAMKIGIFKAIDDLSIAEYFKDIFTATWLKGRWPFMRVITVTNIDWIGKRHIFWGVSAVITVGGLVALGVRGSDAYDTEFNGGTKISFTLQEGKTLNLSDVRKRVYSIAEDPSLDAGQKEKMRDIAGASVYEIGSGGKSFEIVTTIADTATVKRKTLLVDEITKNFRDVLEVTPKLTFSGDAVSTNDIQPLMDQRLLMPITKSSLDLMIPNAPPTSLSEFFGGVAIRLDNINPAQTAAAIETRLANMRQAPDVTKTTPYRKFKVIPIMAENSAEDPKTAALKSAVVVVAADPTVTYEGDRALWLSSYATSEWKIVNLALTTSTGLQGVSSFDAQVASSAKAQAILAIALSLILIVIYVWIRFGGIRYGLGAILSLVHDAVVAVAATVLAGYVANTALGKFLLISDFKINLTIIAAYLTIIGYSVNDTIVIFDRIRENRGRSRDPLSAKLVNDSINQCFGRTIWTTFTVFIVVLIMYIFGGEGIRGFSFAMLIGVFTGAYSTLAIASPMLLNVKDAEPVKTEDSKAIALQKSGLAPQQ